MNIRRKKLIGVLATATFLILYSLVVMAIGGQFVMGLGKMMELGYFIVTGMAWVPVVMIIIRWMSGGSASS
jgi:hypothetical protein